MTKIPIRFLCPVTAMIAFLVAGGIEAQSIRVPWSGYAHDPQHDALAPVASQPLNRILWQTTIDLSVPTNNTSEISIHYGSPVITRSNTVIAPVKVAPSGGFEVMALKGATGATNWVQSTDYILPSHNWIPSFSPALTPRNRLYFPGAGGTVYYCDTPDSTNATPVFGQMAFYGLTNYLANSNAYKGNVFICTPITSDRYGNIFFGFQTTGSAPLNLISGFARIGYDGTGTWIAAGDTTANGTAPLVAVNCSPALSNDHKKLYVAINANYSGFGFLVALDSRTLSPLSSVLLMDVKNPANFATVDGDSTASPTVGPDGDVYYGVLENPDQSHNFCGWLLHFDSTLTQTKIPGDFGWDDTVSVVPASMVPSYHGGSPYLLMTKYNNYAGVGTGNGVNKIAILDPRNSEIDPISGATVMKEVLTITGPRPIPPIQTSRTPCANGASIRRRLIPSRNPCWRTMRTAKYTAGI